MGAIKGRGGAPLDLRPPRETPQTRRTASTARAYADRHAHERQQLVGESGFGAGRVWCLHSRVRAHALPAVDAIVRVLEPLGITPGGSDGMPGPAARCWCALAAKARASFSE